MNGRHWITLILIIPNSVQLKIPKLSIDNFDKKNDNTVYLVETS